MNVPQLQKYKNMLIGLQERVASVAAPIWVVSFSTANALYAYFSTSAEAVLRIYFFIDGIEITNDRNYPQRPRIRQALLFTRTNIWFQTKQTRKKLILFFSKWHC